MLHLGSVYQVYRLIDGGGQPVNEYDRHGNSGLDMEGRYGGYKLLNFVVPYHKHEGYTNMYDAFVIDDIGRLRSKVIDARELMLVDKCGTVENFMKTFSKLRMLNDSQSRSIIQLLLERFQPELGVSDYHRDTNTFDIIDRTGTIVWSYNYEQGRVV